MKINFGEFKGTNIITGNNDKMRPTQSSAKSIIFNLIEPQDKNVLDLFSGTGALGFESASLGAKLVYWIDNNINSINAIKSTIDKLNLDKNNFLTFKTDFRMALKKAKIKFDIIFLDPPFIATKYYLEALDLIFQNKLLNNDGVVVLEKPKKIDISFEENFLLKKSKSLGDKDIILLSLTK